MLWEFSTTHSSESSLLTCHPNRPQSPQVRLASKPSSAATAQLTWVLRAKGAIAYLQYSPSPVATAKQDTHIKYLPSVRTTTSLTRSKGQQALTQRPKMPTIMFEQTSQNRQ